MDSLWYLKGSFWIYLIRETRQWPTLNPSRKGRLLRYYNHSWPLEPKWRLILLSLLVDNFGVKYVGKFHSDHLALVLKQYHTITIYWDAKKYAGIIIKWNYTKRTCRLILENYIRDVLTKYGHPMGPIPSFPPKRTPSLTLNFMESSESKELWEPSYTMQEH